MRTYPVLKTKYTSSPVTVDQAKKWLILDIPAYNAEDAKIQELIDAAVSYVEKECNLSLGVSTYEWNTDFLPCKFADTYLIQSITSIESEAGDDFVEIDPANYKLIRTSETTSRIRWTPTFKTDATYFRVTFTAGYADGKIPPRLLQAVRALVVEWYDDPGDYVREKSTMADKLLQPYVISYAG